MKFILKVLPLFFAAVLFSSCKEEDYTTKSSIVGIIIEAEKYTPIEGAIVTNETTGKTCITKEDGYYEFKDLRFGEEYKIYVNKEGYIPVWKSITPTEVRDKFEENIILSKMP